jgi:hypothetical protein
MKPCPLGQHNWEPTKRTVHVRLWTCTKCGAAKGEFDTDEDVERKFNAASRPADQS